MGDDLVVMESGLTFMPAAELAAVDLVAAWLAGLMPTTVAGYRKDLRDFTAFLDTRRAGHAGPAGALDWFLGLPGGAANGCVLGYRDDQVNRRELAAATVGRRLAAVRSLVKLARSLGRVAWTVEVASPRAEPRRDVRGPDGAGMKKVVRAMKGAGTDRAARMDKALVAVLFGLALRRGEAVGLDLVDVDFAGSRLAVRGKGNREKVWVEMPPEVARDLAGWVAVRGGHAGPLFHGTRGASRFAGSSVLRRVRALGVAADLAEPLRPHGFRHSAITAALSRRESVRDVMGFSRHRKVETVMRYDDALKSQAGRVARENAKTLK